MRLTSDQICTILATIREQANRDARVILFGSRVDDSRRGGDIDLLIESTSPPDLRQRARIKLALETALQISVDVIAKQKDATPTPIQAIAIITGTTLQATQ